MFPVKIKKVDLEVIDMEYGYYAYRLNQHLRNYMKILKIGKIVNLFDIMTCCRFAF